MCYHVASAWYVRWAFPGSWSVTDQPSAGGGVSLAGPGLEQRVRGGGGVASSVCVCWRGAQLQKQMHGRSSQPEESGLPARRGFQGMLWLHCRCTRPPADTNMSRRPLRGNAQQLHTLMGAPQISMHLNQMIVQARHHWCNSRIDKCCSLR